MNNITESFHNYNGWGFRIRAAKNNGIWTTTFKDTPTGNINSKTGIKRLYLREKGWTYKEVDKLIKETKNFIDNHEENLFKSLEKQKIKHKIL